MLITIKEKTISDAWRAACRALYRDGFKIDNGEAFRDSAIAIEVEDITRDRYDPLFPMTENEIEIINTYLATGVGEEKIIHDWTKLYRRRLFEENGDQIDRIIEYLKNKPQGKRAQASVWKQDIDLAGPIAPCLQMLWFQIQNGALELHAHIRATDCYGKLLMNMSEFSALQIWAAGELGVPPGKYVQFADTCHFYTEAKDKVGELITKLG